MSVSSFIHVNKAENKDFDLEKFNREMEKKYPGTDIEQSSSTSFSYDLCWENYSETYQFTLRMDKKRTTFAIEYFNSENRMKDYASLIVWLSLFLNREQELILCDENNEDILMLSANTSVEDIEEWLEKLGI
ncbi:MAG: hypothetical protein HXK82_09555 [Lachnospiraceae bacterium]|nr:hypothetical protein [Lachnospiraceae bacterium]